MSIQAPLPDARPDRTAPDALTQATIVSVNDGPRPRSSAILYLVMAVAGIAILGGTLAMLGNFRLSQATTPKAPKVALGTPIDPPTERLARFDITHGECGPCRRARSLDQRRPPCCTAPCTRPL